MDVKAARPRSRIGISSIAAIALNGLQLASAVVILGLIGVRFYRTSFSSAVYTIIISVLTIFTAGALIFLQLRPAQRRLIILASFGWQVVLVILWAAAAGTLGNQGNWSRSTGLRAAMALALIEMLAFLIGSVVVGFALWRGRRAERKLVGSV